ncbi:DUF6629 family protein [Cyanobium sp. CH-040]|uniref:DUF6629 family protein n=1 Tax=Cyanobium sp. CH-040 TaxID=2823708 RepID=UPI0020CB7913|nr:DUF6629 family protein [Cyanobium sp. CH-040]MCP9927021.1 hypothetical protein [Cyanobium sp. CH-040]
MCFSSEASFIAAAALVPAGALALGACRRHQRTDLLSLALCPWLFGVQQAFEGLVWLGLDAPVEPPFTHGAAVAFLFFAHGFWPAWIPWCALQAARLRRPDAVPLLRLLSGLGVLLGLWLWLPLALEPGRVLPVVVGGSISYQSRLLADGLLSRELGVSSYALVVLVPLLLSGSRRLAWYAFALLVSVVVSWIAFTQAFTSVWCFLAAVLALLIPWVAAERLPSAGPEPAELETV